MMLDAEVQAGIVVDRAGEAVGLADRPKTIGTFAARRRPARSAPMIDWAWLGDHLGAIAYRTLPAHLSWPSIAVVVGFAISFGLARGRSSRRRWTYPPDQPARPASSTRSRAWPLFAALVSITGLTILTAEIPLILYTLVILVRNIVAGFDGVPADVLEAADGMGYSAPRSASARGAAAGRAAGRGRAAPGDASRRSAS